MFFYIEPEVAGGIGPNSETHRENGKLVVTRLNYEFSGWLGDAVLESTPCFLVTETARQMLEKQRYRAFRSEMSRSADLEYSSIYMASGKCPSSTGWPSMASPKPMTSEWRMISDWLSQAGIGHSETRGYQSC